MKKNKSEENKQQNQYETLEDNPQFQEHMEVLRRGYPDLPYEEQCHGADFRENADKIAELIAKETLKTINSKERTTILMPWRAGLIFWNAL